MHFAGVVTSCPSTGHEFVVDVTGPSSLSYEPHLPPVNHVDPEKQISPGKLLFSFFPTNPTSNARGKWWIGSNGDVLEICS
jgi:hypothetical protein